MCIWIHEGVQRAPNAVNARLGGKLGRAKVAATAKTRRRRDIKKIDDKKRTSENDWGRERERGRRGKM